MSELVDAASATYGVEIRLVTIVAHSQSANAAALRRASLPKKVAIRRAEIERCVFTCSLP
jgi:hypothetical protein